MNCQQCGNEVQPDELFCGQCGTAIVSSALPTSRVNSVLLGNEDLSVLDKTAQQPRTPHPQVPSTPTSPHPQTRKLFSPPGGLFSTHHLSPQTSGSQQGIVGGQQHQTGFYQDATEAMSLSSNEAAVSQAADHSRQPFASPQVQNDLSIMGQRRLPVWPSNQSLYADQYMLQNASHSGRAPSGHGYDYGRLIRPAIPPQSHKQQPGSTVLIVSICLVGALISVIISVSVIFLRGSSQSAETNESVSPTAVLQPTPMPTPTPQIITLTPTPAPTPFPDPGFMWCGPNCTNYAFSVEYPSSWQLGGASTNNGIQFTNPSQPDQIATFKAIGPTVGSAGDILNSELQTNFVNKPGYIPPQGTGVTTLGGETWVMTTVYYQSADQQREHVVLYTIVYQSKGYAIEIQAPDPDGQQFTLVYNSYYMVMLSKFSFV